MKENFLLVPGAGRGKCGNPGANFSAVAAVRARPAEFKPVFTKQAQPWWALPSLSPLRPRRAAVWTGASTWAAYGPGQP